MSEQISFLPMPMREVIAREIYAQRPFTMATTISVMDGMGVATRFSWDGAPACYQDECYALADAIVAALFLRQQAGDALPIRVELAA